MKPLPGAEPQNDHWTFCSLRERGIGNSRYAAYILAAEPLGIRPIPNKCYSHSQMKASLPFESAKIVLIIFLSRHKEMTFESCFLYCTHNRGHGRF